MTIYSNSQNYNFVYIQFSITITVYQDNNVAQLHTRPNTQKPKQFFKKKNPKDKSPKT